jgi:hypothetical protein
MIRSNQLIVLLRKEALIKSQELRGEERESQTKKRLA